MKKSYIAFLALVLVVVASSLTIYFSNKNRESMEFEKFYLDEVETNLTHLSHSFASFEIDGEKLNSLIENKSNFALSIYEPSCITSSNFDGVLSEFRGVYNIDFYRVAFSDLKETDLGETIKYYPSFAVLKDGELIDYLQADKDEDSEYYKNVEGFKKWLDQYIFIAEKNKEEVKSSQSKETQTSSKGSGAEETSQSKEEIKDVSDKIVIEGITYNKNKINLYLFWREGCVYCYQEKAYLETLKKEYGNLFQINEFEISKSSKNMKILEYFSGKMGDNVTGVPYTIIGNKSFTGFADSYKEEFIKTIKEQHKDSYDVYFSN